MKLIAYILIMSALFAQLNWRVVHLTRIANHDLVETMHKYERVYSLATTTLFAVLCAPCFALEPQFYLAFMNAETTPEQRQAIVHYPYSGNPLAPDGFGIWRMTARGGNWYRVPLWQWYAGWIPLSATWLLMVYFLFKLRR